MKQAIKIIKGVLALIALCFVTGAVFGTAWGAFKLASRFVQSLL